MALLFPPQQQATFSITVALVGNLSSSRYQLVEWKVVCGGQLTIHGDVFPLPGEHPALGSDLVCGGGGGDGVGDDAGSFR